MKFDSALGLEMRRGPLAVLFKIVIYAGMVLIFAGPLFGLLVSAFNKTLDPTSFSFWPDEFTLDNFVQAATGTSTSTCSTRSWWSGSGCSCRCW